MVEGLLRIIGLNSTNDKVILNSPVFHKEDHQLGWQLIPGDYLIPINKFGDEMNLSIKEVVGRITRPVFDSLKEDQIFFVGGSFTMGRGVNDDETAIWKVQEMLPHYDVRNLAVGGYGTYQSLMVMENQINKGLRPKAFIYGLIENHKMRNVAEHVWMESLYRNSHGIDTPKIPYISLNERGGLKRNEPASYVSFKLSDYLVLALLFERSYNKIHVWGRRKQSDEVLKKLLLEMKSLSESNSIDFYVSVLHWNDDSYSELIDFLDESSIGYFDLNIPLNEGNTFRDDGHPKKEVHAIWANRLIKNLKKEGY